MKLKSIFILAVTLLSAFTTVEARSTKHNNLPMARFVVTPDLACDDFGVSLLGEIGSRTYRGNGSVGFAWDNCSRVKIGGEYLGDKLRYNFGRCDQERKWTQQWAVGGQYEYLLCCDCIESIAVGVDYSRAKTNHLNDREIDGEFIGRHIAGSRYWDVYAGATVQPWECAHLFAALTFDDIRFDKRFHCKKKYHRGVGVEFVLTQDLDCNVDFTIHGAWRQPYREIGAYANWNNPCDCFGWGVGLFVDYVNGRNHVPNALLYGIQLSYSFGLDDCCPTVCQPEPCCGKSMKNWVADPAVYRPIVFAGSRHHHRELLAQ